MVAQRLPAQTAAGSQQSAAVVQRSNSFAHIAGVGEQTLSLGPSMQ
jgi:hypothetical protein